MTMSITHQTAYTAIYSRAVERMIQRAKAAKDRELSPSKMRRRLRKGLPAKPTVLRP